jgi:hypothetical protein
MLIGRFNWMMQKLSMEEHMALTLPEANRPTIFPMESVLDCRRHQLCLIRNLEECVQHCYLVTVPPV